MTGRARARRGRIRAGLSAAGLLALAFPGLAVPVLAQDEDGGVTLTFGLNSRIIGQDNATLEPDGSTSSIESSTQLTFGYRTATPQAFVAIDAATRLRYINDDDLENGLIDPGVTLSFGRNSIDQTLDGSLFWNETDLSQDQGLDDFDGTEGTRRTIGGEVLWRWGEDARFGGGLSLRHVETDYFDAPDENDTVRTTLGGDLRFDLTEVTALTIGASRSRFEEEGEDTRYTNSLDAGLTFDRPNAPLSFDLGLDDTEDGVRTRGGFGTTYETAGGTRLSPRIGLTRPATGGGLSPTFGLDYARPLPRGEVTASISQDYIPSDTDDSEARTTRVSAALNQELTPLATLSADIGLSEREESDTGEVERNASAGVTLSYDIGQDWLLDTGIRHRIRDETDEDTARDTSLFVGVRRTWERRY